MKPVNQTGLGIEDGDCWNACVASIFEIELDTIPYFRGTSWAIDFEEWLIKIHAYYPVFVNLPFNFRPSGYYIMSGKSPRGDFHHSIVMYNGEFKHDPYPGGAGVLESREEYCFFAPLDPSRITKNE